jgi:hypothetical protein
MTTQTPIQAALSYKDDEDQKAAQRESSKRKRHERAYREMLLTVEPTDEIIKKGVNAARELGYTNDDMQRHAGFIANYRHRVHLTEQLPERRMAASKASDARQKMIRRHREEAKQADIAYGRADGARSESVRAERDFKAMRTKPLAALFFPEEASEPTPSRKHQGMTAGEVWQSLADR